jgi:hypothetical protein
MSSVASSAQLILALSSLMYASSVTSVALVAALVRDAERRRHACETLRVLVRHRTERLGRLP